jgi:polyphosphate glucokinase
MNPGILAIDIGGTGLKATVVDEKGNMLAERVRVPTPHPCPPELLVSTVAKMVKLLPSYNRISIGFPGVVRDGKVLTAPNLDTKLWAGFPLVDAMSKALGGLPARLLNDADMQGLALISGHGLEFVMTLGTGVGTSLYRNGELMPHMELAHHPIHKSKTYDEYLGDAEFKSIGKKRWNKRLQVALSLVDMLLVPDRIYIGGGNARNVTLELDQHISTGSNDAGLEGGAALWRDTAPGKAPRAPQRGSASAARQASREVTERAATQAKARAKKPAANGAKPAKTVKTIKSKPVTSSKRIAARGSARSS